jgi:hypothetical protein
MKEDKVRQNLQKTIQKKIPGALSSGIARTRYIDDLLELTVEQGIQQVIIPGAGFDTRALRLAALQSIPVIEIDHPNTSRKKLQTLTKHLRRLPEHVHIGGTSGSYIIFTYVHSQVLTNPQAFFGAPRLLDDLANIEEKWTFGFNPEELSGYLGNFQFSLLEDSGASQYRNRYLPDRTERGYEFYRVAFAKKI